jgi:hypothetical protein
MPWIAWAIYVALLPVSTVWAMVSGWRSDRPELTRCGAVVMLHAVMMQAAALAWPPIAGQGYPFIFITATLVGALCLVCVPPAGKANAMLAGSILFGILTGLIYGVSVFWHGFSGNADWVYFAAQFTMGWANIIILLGWTHERSLRRVADSCFSAFARLVRVTHISGVAR